MTRNHSARYCLVMLAGTALTLAAALLAGCGAIPSATEPQPVSTASSTDVSILCVDRSAVHTASGCTLGLADTTIKTSGDEEAAAMATDGGELDLDNVSVVTSGTHSIPLATGSGGGTLTVNGGKAISSGAESPCLYSTDAIVVTGSICQALKSEAAVMEGSGSIHLTDVVLSAKSSGRAVTIFGGASTETGAANGSFTMDGGSLVYTARHGSLFYVSGCAGTITLSGVRMAGLSETLLTAAADNAGVIGSSGGDAVLVADDQVMVGDLIADTLSTLSVSLKNGSSLTGAINPDGTARTANLVLDSNSTWKVSADSHLTSLDLVGGVSGETIENIQSNGHTIYYDPNSAADAALGGKTYDLKGGGMLTPTVQAQVSRSKDTL